MSALGVSRRTSLSLAQAMTSTTRSTPPYHTKYDRHSGYVEPTVAPQARATTLTLVPDDRASCS
jgi:hypothetical protein